MESNLSVVLVMRNDAERTQLRAAFEAYPGVQIAGERSDLRAGLAMAHQTRPAILVLELAPPVDEILNAASQFRMQYPESAIFLIGDAFDPDTLLRALRAGAQEVLRRPLDRAALTAAIQRVAALAARKQGNADRRRVVTVFSSKGGSGVSTIAANLAICLKRVSGREVALADFDNQSGDGAFQMGLTPQRSLADVLSSARVDSASIQDALVKHESGVLILAQPEQLDQADGVNGPQIGGAIDILADTFDFVVIDTPHVINDVTLEIFVRSSNILVIVQRTVASVRAARRALDVLEKLNYLVGPDRVQLVVNRHGASHGITMEQLEETVGMPVFASVANDYAAVSRGIDTGKALCDQAPDNRAARDLDALARRLIGPVNGRAEVEPVLMVRPARSWFFGRRKAS